MPQKTNPPSPDRLAPHEYRAPRRVPLRGHLALPCVVCGSAFGAAIHRRIGGC